MREAEFVFVPLLGRLNWVSESALVLLNKIVVPARCRSSRIWWGAFTLEFALSIWAAAAGMR